MEIMSEKQRAKEAETEERKGREGRRVRCLPLKGSVYYFCMLSWTRKLVTFMLVMAKASIFNTEGHLTHGYHSA